MEAGLKEKINKASLMREQLFVIFERIWYKNPPETQKQKKLRMSPLKTKFSAGWDDREIN